MTLTFEINGYGGKKCAGRGTLIDKRLSGYVVGLLTDDLGGFGTYRRGAEIIVAESELTMPERQLQRLNRIFA